MNHKRGKAKKARAGLRCGCKGYKCNGLGWEKRTVADRRKMQP